MTKYLLKPREHECWQFEGFESVEFEGQELKGCEVPPWVAALVVTGHLRRCGKHLHLKIFDMGQWMDEIIEPGDWIIDTGHGFVPMPKESFFDFYEPLKPTKETTHGNT